MLGLFSALLVTTGLATQVPAPPGKNPLPSHFVATTGMVQHLPLIGGLGRIKLDLDGLGREITLKPSANLQRLAQHLQQYAAPGSICPAMYVVERSIHLLCETRRIDTKIFYQKGRPILEIRVLRGVPFTGKYDPGPFPFIRRAWSGFHMNLVRVKPPSFVQNVLSIRAKKERRSNFLRKPINPPGRTGLLSAWVTLPTWMVMWPRQPLGIRASPSTASYLVWRVLGFAK